MRFWESEGVHGVQGVRPLVIIISPSIRELKLAFWVLVECSPFNIY